MTFSMNAKKIGKGKGTLAYQRMTADNIACSVDMTLDPTTPLVPAQAVKLITSASSGKDSPIFVTPAAPGDDIFGFVCYSLRSDVFYAGSQVDIAVSQAIMVMEASVALNAGTRVGINTNVQIVDATTAVPGTLNQIGLLLNTAQAEGDLASVFILTPGLTAPAV